MALQMISHTFRPSPPLPSIGSLPAKQSTTVTTGSVFRSVKLGLRNVKVRSSSLEGFSSAGTEVVNKAVIGVVTEVDKDTFWPIVEDAADKTVVLDMYTQWCGPCKVIAPKFQGLAEKYDDVVFLKLDCNEENKPLAKELGIKVVPTFKILKHGKIVKEITGAKFDNLVIAMEEVRSS
nr:thioredoxin F-type, chloroplastic-like [Tanacetum cinerariifolium]